MTAPPPDREQRSLQFLDWPEVLLRLAAEARSDRGRAACAALTLLPTADDARARMAEVAELAGLLRAARSLPGLAFPDVEPFLFAAEKGIMLGPEELRPVAELGEVSGNVLRFFARDAAAADEVAGAAGTSRATSGRTPADDAPLVAAIIENLDPCRPLTARIRGTFDPTGEVRDAVSPELARLRREREALSARVRGEIEQLMEADEYASVLQDRFWTMRGDRYVLPLRASAKSLGLGIVHDTSRTGETVFVEPTVVVGLNNRLKLAELEIAREVRRILEELTADVARAAPALRGNLELLETLDVVAAKARLGVAYGGWTVEIADQPVIALAGARHPLLTLRALREGFRVVENDVALTGQPVKVLIVSGPNAGGKTVLLKTLGLAALLVRAGMLVPASAGGRVGFFSAVLADIGDQQSVMGDLSTFSAHLAALGEILRHDAGQVALVLLDELMAGTNPDQGAALARATAEALVERAGLAVITTHYDALKALAESDGRFRNAGMEYDPERLHPTFRLRDGTPGRSYALDIATRMGLPPALLQRAHQLTGGANVGLEQVIAVLEAREVALKLATDQLSEARQLLAERDQQQQAAVAALERRERELGRHSREAIDAAVREAREAIRAVVREAQQAGSARAGEEARVRLDVVAREALAGFPAPAPAAAGPAPPPLQPGARVFVPSLSAEGRVLHAPDSRGRVKVAVGALTVDVDLAELSGSSVPAASARKPGGGGRGAAGQAVPGGGSKPRAGGRAGGSPDGGGPKSGSGGSIGSGSGGNGPAPEDASDPLVGLVRPASGNTLDLRGRRADDVREEVVAYLDRAALEGRSPVFVIHGHGTGVLRKIVRELVADSPYVRRWAPAGKAQGGDGVTVIELA